VTSNRAVQLVAQLAEVAATSRVFRLSKGWGGRLLGISSSPWGVFLSIWVAGAGGGAVGEWHIACDVSLFVYASGS